MKANVNITKSFDRGRELSKNWEKGDFEEFMKEEGEYLDRLCTILARGGEGDEFTVTYTVTVRK